jgi:hypothetical protein
MRAVCSKILCFTTTPKPLFLRGVPDAALPFEKQMFVEHRWQR